jgi:hypothetical protein
MDDVTLGVGDLAGVGVYAARTFAAGDVVVRYELRPLTAEDYDRLPGVSPLKWWGFGGSVSRRC